MNNLPPPSKNESSIETLKLKIKELHASYLLVVREKLATFKAKNSPEAERKAIFSLLKNLAAQIVTLQNTSKS